MEFRLILASICMIVSVPLFSGCSSITNSEIVSPNVEARDQKIVDYMASDQAKGIVNFGMLKETFEQNGIVLDSNEIVIKTVTESACRYVCSYPSEDKGWLALKRAYAGHDGEYAYHTKIIKSSYEKYPKIFNDKAKQSQWVRDLIDQLSNIQ